MPFRIKEILPDLYQIQDSCNVYLIREGNRAVTIDFGSGDWLSELPRLGIEKLDHVLLTHHHPDQCFGLEKQGHCEFEVHAAAGAEAFLQPKRVSEYWRTRWLNGVPASYSVLREGIPAISYDISQSKDIFWCGKRIRFLPTPGHGPHAHSVVFDMGVKQIVSCGDAVHAGATVHEPFHLEWDHWTGSGALAAWCGIKRLSQIAMDLLCPAHGPVIHEPRQCLRQLLEKLMDFYESKLSIAAGEPDNYWQPAHTTDHYKQVLPHLYQFGGNGYLLLSKMGEALVVDPFLDDLPALEKVQKACGEPKISAALVSHYHYDHCNAADKLREHFGTEIWLHPWIAKPLENVKKYDLPWLWTTDIPADALLPEQGSWQWNEYEFKIAPFPGQTWWHAAYQTLVDDKRAFFGGDNFQPPSRWHGTGGYCSYNGSRFQEGFVRSAELVKNWAPDLLCCGHGTFFHFNPEQFDKISLWAQKTEKAIQALCPSKKLEADYHLHKVPQPTFRDHAQSATR